MMKDGSLVIGKDIVMGLCGRSKCGIQHVVFIVKDVA